ncbi:MAG: hypothetical protein RIQ93_708 [Verrucomicrobiota bacterium]|jgi:hypothetical protein
MSRHILLFLFFVGALLSAARDHQATARDATPEEKNALEDAVRNFAADYTRWACTETTIQLDEKGKPKRQSVVRYDPSRPYEEQWTPLEINGKPPTGKETARYRRRGLLARKREENPETDPRKALGEVIQFERATVVSAGADGMVFEVPLSKADNVRFPPEKFRVFVRLAPDGKTLANVSLRLRESFRMKVLAKVKSGDGSLDFSVIDPKFAPALSSMKGDASVSVLFVSVGGTIDLQRSDFKRVKPYNERFGVQIGPLKALDF